MAGDKLPMWATAKGETNRVINSQFGGMAPDPDVVFANSPSGWVNQSIMKQYLNWLSQKFQGDPMALVTDSYACHYSESVIEAAALLNIEIIIIPPGGTPIYQPLDIAIFGILKSKAEVIFRQLYITDPYIMLNKCTGCFILKKAWDELTEHHILKGWERYSPIDIRYLMNE